MKFYVVEDNNLVEKDGYCVKGKFHAVKVEKGNWVVYDSKSGVKLVGGMKTITACIDWVKSTDGVAAIEALRGPASYASLTAAMKEYRHAHKLVTPEVVEVETVPATDAADAVEVEATPVVK